MSKIRMTDQGRRCVASMMLVLGILAGASIALAPTRVVAKPPADAPSTADAEGELKAEWQGRYRALRNNAVRMRENATKLRRAYGLAQHANYPRGGARESFKQQVLDTERKADQYEAELAGFMDEARANDIPPGWIYEIDDEPIDHGLPAAAGDGEDEALEGRNPLYADEDDDDEAADEVGDADEDERRGRAGDVDDDSDREEDDDQADDEDADEDR